MWQWHVQILLYKSRYCICYENANPKDLPIFDHFCWLCCSIDFSITVNQISLTTFQYIKFSFKSPLNSRRICDNYITTVQCFSCLAGPVANTLASDHCGLGLILIPTCKVVCGHQMGFLCTPLFLISIRWQKCHNLCHWEGSLTCYCNLNFNCCKIIWILKKNLYY